MYNAGTFLTGLLFVSSIVNVNMQEISFQPIISEQPLPEKCRAFLSCKNAEDAVLFIGDEVQTQTTVIISGGGRVLLKGFDVDHVQYHEASELLVMAFVANSTDGQAKHCMTALQTDFDKSINELQLALFSKLKCSAEQNTDNLRRGMPFRGHVFFVDEARHLDLKQATRPFDGYATVVVPAPNFDFILLDTLSDQAFYEFISRNKSLRDVIKARVNGDSGSIKLPGKYGGGLTAGITQDAIYFAYFSPASHSSFEPSEIVLGSALLSDLENFEFDSVELPLSSPSAIAEFQLASSEDGSQALLFYVDGGFVFMLDLVNDTRRALLGSGSGVAAAANNFDGLIVAWTYSDDSTIGFYAECEGQIHRGALSRNATFLGGVLLVDVSDNCSATNGFFIAMQSGNRTITVLSSSADTTGNGDSYYEAYPSVGSSIGGGSGKIESEEAGSFHDDVIIASVQSGSSGSGASLPSEDTSEEGSPAMFDTPSSATEHAVFGLFSKVAHVVLVCGIAWFTNE